MTLDTVPACTPLRTHESTPGLQSQVSHSATSSLTRTTTLYIRAGAGTRA